MLQLPSKEKSLWRDDYSAATYPHLSEDLEVDVAIVGAGITGLTSAYLLKQAGFTVAVLDKDTVGGGTSGRTTGKVTSLQTLIYSDIDKHLGRETARIYGEANQAAVEKVDEIIRKEKISCDWRLDDNYTYTDQPDQIDQFKQEAKIAAGIGLPASFEADTPLPFEVKAAVKFSGQGKIHAQKYALGLARLVDGNGSRVFEKSGVIGIRDGQPGRVKTTQAKVIAKNIIVATNVPTLPLIARGGYCLLEYPTESYIVAGPLEKDIKGMYISPDEHNYSIFPIAVDEKPLLLVGGESNISGMRLNTDAKYQRLADYAEARFGLKTITHRWSDRDYLAYDSIPLIGKLYPWSKNVYVASAFRKWGLSNGTVAAIILSDLISGNENPWASTFNSSRLKPVKSIPRVASEYISKIFS